MATRNGKKSTFRAKVSKKVVSTKKTKKRATKSKKDLLSKVLDLLK